MDLTNLFQNVVLPSESSNGVFQGGLAMIIS